MFNLYPPTSWYTEFLFKKKKLLKIIIPENLHTQKLLLPGLMSVQDVFRIQIFIFVSYRNPKIFYFVTLGFNCHPLSIRLHYGEKKKKSDLGSKMSKLKFKNPTCKF